MANFRVEQARILFSEPIPGFDPNRNIDPNELCWIDAGGQDSNYCDLKPLHDFYAADFADWNEDDLWFSSHEGLETVNGLLSFYRKIIETGNDPFMRKVTVIQKDIELLEAVQVALQTAYDHDVLFCIKVTD